MSPPSWWRAYSIGFGTSDVFCFDDFVSRCHFPRPRRAGKFCIASAAVYRSVKTPKSKLRPAVAFLVLLGAYLDKETDFVLRICLPGEEVDAWSTLTLSYLTRNGAHSQELG